MTDPVSIAAWIFATNGIIGLAVAGAALAYCISMSIFMIFMIIDVLLDL